MLIFLYISWLQQCLVHRKHRKKGRKGGKEGERDREGETQRGREGVEKEGGRREGLSID